MDTDRNLLFGVLALQLDLIDRDRFVEACTLWTTRKQTPLADLLVERGWLTAADRADVERLLQRKLEKHAGDAHASLAEVADGEVQRVLAVLGDPAVAESLAGLSRHDGQVLLTTVNQLPETRERYTLSRLHAQGGIGQVWLARDASLGREVALKELRPERVGSPVVWARFLQEAQITGQLEHPGIVPVYELSRRPDDRQPFYTMRFVRGRTLSAAIQGYHEKRRAGEAGPLDQQALLQAFVAVCNAVAYAHSRGVVHRDLKGQNVVLGDFGEVMVLDWGLAKVLARPEAGDTAPPVALDPETEHEATLQGQVLGTPAYMAPEQADGRLDLIDPRTDVYGLGAILYELLAGRPPFSGASTQEVLRKVREEEPERPRRVLAGVPAPLEAVCLKALAKRREDRYATAGALAEDVRRFLADEPVTAQREPWSVRAGRWVKHHRPLVAGAAAAVLVAAVSFAVATVFLTAANERERTARKQALDNEREAGLQRDEAKKQRDEAQTQRDEAQKQRDRAQANFKLAHEAVDQYLNRVSENTLLEQPGLQSLRKDLLASALPFYRRFAEEQQGNPAARLELAEAHARRAWITYEADSWAGALPYYEKAAQLLEELAHEKPSDKDYQRRLMRLYRQLACLCYLNQQPGAAQGYLVRAQDLAKGLDGDRARQAEQLMTQAVFWQVAQQSSRAEPGLRKARELLDKLMVEDPDNVDYQNQLAICCVLLGMVYQGEGRPADAEEAIQRGQAMWKRLAARYPAAMFQARAVALGQTALAEFYRSSNQPAKAAPAYEEAVASLKALADKNPTLTDVQVCLGLGAEALGHLYLDAHKPEQAATAFQQAVAALDRVVAQQPGDARFRYALGDSMAYLGQCYQNTHRLAEAEALHQKALALRQALADKEPNNLQYQNDLGFSYQNLGWVCHANNQMPQAEAAYRKALAVQRRLVDKNPDNTYYLDMLSFTHHALGQVCVATHRPAEAEAAFQEALALREKLAGKNPNYARAAAFLAETELSLGDLARAAEKPEAALERFGQAVTWYQRATEQDPGNVAARYGLGLAHAQRASTLVRLGRYEEALPDVDPALPLLAPPQQAGLRATRAIALAYLGQHGRAVAEAEAVAREAALPAGVSYDLACAYAVASAAVTKDQKLPPTQREKLTSRCAATAMELLGKARDDGVFRNPAAVANLKKDRDLDPLRQREDFRKLLAGLEDKPAP
jgi:serine/threonine protein kinase